MLAVFMFVSWAALVVAGFEVGEEIIWLGSLG